MFPRFLFILLFLSNLGTCQCFPEYTGSACDIKIADPPILSSIFGGATCDVYLDDCTAFTVLGLNFLDEDTLTCHYMLDNGVSSIVISLTFSMPVESYSFDLYHASRKLFQELVYTKLDIIFYISSTTNILINFCCSILQLSKK